MDQVEKKVKLEQSGLDKLKDLTSIVVDSSDFEQMKEYKAEDATTNPSLILQASEQGKYKAIIEESIKEGIQELQRMQIERTKKKQKGKKSNVQKQEQEEKRIAMQEEQDSKEFIYEEQSDQDKIWLVERIVSIVCVRFGIEILNIVPGYVSTEIDARLSFDSEAMVQKAKEIIDLYAKKGIHKSRVLIKIASTWEGIKAGIKLKKIGIECNMTLIFNYVQAICCGVNELKLISPFVGRIYDYYVTKQKNEDFSGEKDPGVISVSNIYNYFKKHHIPTIVMGASFRNTNQILQLAGCDKLTISPSLLNQLSKINVADVQTKLSTQAAQAMDIQKVDTTEVSFRWHLNQDPMATEKLAEGIRKFSEDTIKLENMIIGMMMQKIVTH